MANRGLLQAAGSWSLDACCAVPGNECHTLDGQRYCWDRASSSDWLFGLWPGPPQRFEPTGNVPDYQTVVEDRWPEWGGNYDLYIGDHSGAPGNSNAGCGRGGTYRGTDGEICGGYENWGATDVEVWYPR
eukprot:COSAG04_NODE_1355_length_7112_cov_3.537716_3_plen_130_part_00